MEIKVKSKINWMESLVLMALEYEFINPVDKMKALEELKEFSWCKNADHFWLAVEGRFDLGKEVSYLITRLQLASQI
jgi:hypothetical protein